MFTTRQETVRWDQLKNPVFNRNPEDRKATIKKYGNFDPDLVGMPDVWQNGLDYLILDGSGRQFMALRDGYGDRSVVVKVYSGLTEAEARELWRKLNTQRTALNTVDVFLSNYRAGDDVETEIMSILSSHSLTVSKHKDIGVTQAVQVLYEAFGYGVLDRVIRVAKSGFGLGEATNKDLLAGLTKLFVYHKENVDDDRLIEKLQQYGGTAKKFVEVSKRDEEASFPMLKDRICTSLIRLYNQGTKGTGIPQLSYLPKRNKRRGMKNPG